MNGFRLIFSLLICSIILLFTSCNSNVFYEKSDPIEKGIWDKNHILHYQFEVKDSMEYYDIYVDVRNTIDYKYQNLYIFLTTEYPGGARFTDTLGCILCDKYGEWYGKGKGEFRDNNFLLMRQVRFQRTGIYNLYVEQAMREDELQGISDFGIRINHFKPQKQRKDQASN